MCSSSKFAELPRQIRIINIKTATQNYAKKNPQKLHKNTIQNFSHENEVTGINVSAYPT